MMTELSFITVQCAIQHPVLLFNESNKSQ